MLPLVLKHIKEGDTVIDAGSFIGDHTIAYCQAVGITGTVIAVEPNQEALKCLSHNLGNTKCNLKVLRNYLTDDITKTASVVSNQNAGASTLALSDAGDVLPTTIDSWKLERCDFIKMDIEGFEAKALMGAAETIKKFKPILLIEVNEGALNKQGHTADDIFEQLTDLYYSCNIYPEQLMTGPQFDIICIPKI
jgi:FkbM family methyltransferase